MRYEVRCCCSPERLYGWLEVPHRYEGGRQRFAMRGMTRAGESETVELEYVEVYVPSAAGGYRYEALKYADETIEPAEKLQKLKRLRGFCPAKVMPDTSKCFFRRDHNWTASSAEPTDDGWIEIYRCTECDRSKRVPHPFGPQAWRVTPVE